LFNELFTHRYAYICDKKAIHLLFVHRLATTINGDFAHKKYRLVL